MCAICKSDFWGQGEVQDQNPLFAHTRTLPHSFAPTHGVVPLPPLSIFTHLGPETEMLLSFWL